MSASRVSSHRSKSSNPNLARNTNYIPPQPSLTPENTEREFEPCAATSSYLLYAQRNIVLCVHHDTLAIERRFDRHREDVRWIAADTVSERGAGRLAVSYDAGHTAIVWDIGTGDEIARFAAYEEIRVATWMRNGNIAFGNVQGNVILFEPSTSEHVSARTIYDPITAIAPVADNRTFAIGYLNGSILIATLQPFTMVHSLNASNAPSRVTGLAWHGSATRQKSDMLATQTADGNLKVWSIPKVPNSDSPNIIRILNKPDGREPGPCWFAWSKLGRIVQHSGGETRSWDVRTKNVTCEVIPTLDGIVGITNCGPTSTLFTLGNNHTVQQFDINPAEKPQQVASAQHAPANTPPSPPNSIEEQKGQGSEAVAVLPTLVSFSDAEISESEGSAMSPLQRIAKEMDKLEEERRDRVGPLSPVSSRASSVSSCRSSEGSRRAPSYRYDKPPSSRASNHSANEGTEFSFSQPIRQPARESISIKSASSFTSPRYRTSGLRKEVLRSPDEAQTGSLVDLFPFVKARLADVPFRTPHYGQVSRTPDVLRREMLSVVFGWNDDIEMMVRDERSRHSPSSASVVLLSQWLGDLGAESMASMIGSESMTSADWMLLALSTMGHASQKKVGEAFVHRLLEKGDVHPAVAILLGLREENDAVEVYVSRNYYLEAILLTCLVFPSDWQRQSYLVRKWGEILVGQGQPELAVRCFSCTSVETSEPWFSPRAQDSVFAAQREHMFGRSVLSSPSSPPSATESGRMRSRQGSLKLITTFGDKGAPMLASSSQQNTPMASMLGVGVTPIAESAISPGGVAPWLRPSQKKERDPSSARTATPGGYGRVRVPSQTGGYRTRAPGETPLTAAKISALPFAKNDSSEQLSSTHARRKSSISSSDTPQTVDSSSSRSENHNISNSERLPSPAQDVFARLKDDPKTRNGSRERLPVNLQVQVYDTAYLGPSSSSAQRSVSKFSSTRSQDTRTSDHHLENRAQGHSERTNEVEQSHIKWDHSHHQDKSENRGRPDMRYIRPAKRSPSSPIPMSPEEVAAATRAMTKQTDGRNFTQQLSSLESIDKRPSSRARNCAPSQQRQHEIENNRSERKGTSQQRKLTSKPRSPSSPRPMSPGSAARERGDEIVLSVWDKLHPNLYSSDTNEPSPDDGKTQSRVQDGLARKRLAAKELEERRASLARRPSAPLIPLPGQSPNKRPPMAARFHTELGDAPHSFLPPMSNAVHGRSHTADPHEMTRFAPRLSGTSSPSTAIGLPATPRALRHPYYMNTDSGGVENIPAVPSLREGLPDHPLTPHGQSPEADVDHAAPLLPNTVFSIQGPSSPPRSASVPLERGERSMEGGGLYKAAPLLSGGSASSNRGHVRRTSQPENQISNKRFSPASIDETLHEAQVVFINADDSSDVMLPELMHLATPPPPPPPPMFSQTPSTSSSNLGIIDIAIEEEAPMVVDVVPTPERTATTSPTATMNSHRRDRNSESDGPGLGSRIRNVTERMRSTSRSRAKSPTETFRPLPYETVLPQVAARRESITRTKSPYEHSIGGTPAPDSTSIGMHLSGQALPPEDITLPPSRTGSAFQGYRKEIRANMPPETLQQGTYEPGNMI